MTIYLKQSTASQEIPLGYFVDSSDGDTAETGLTIANTDIQLWKSGATTLANKNSGGATHISGGIYYAVLDATDTDTLGPLVIFVHVAGALAVRLECVVLAANVYDSMIGGTDALQVHASEISNDLITAAAIATDAIDADALKADAVTEIQAGLSSHSAADVWLVATRTLSANTNFNDPTAAAIADAVWDEVITGAAHNVSNSAAKFLREAAEAIGVTGTAQSGTSTTVTLAAAASAADDIYNGERIGIIEGTGAGQYRLITDYAGTTKVATVSRAWDVTPDNTSVYVLSGADVDAVMISGAVTAADNVEANIANLDAAVSTVLADTNELQADLTNGGRLDLLIDAIKAKTDNLPASPSDLALTDTVEGAVTLLGLLRHLLAFVGGETEGANTTNPRFKSQDGLTDRISMTVDSDGDRSAVTLDAS